MKSWKCPECAWIKDTEDNIKIVFCSCCLTEMKPYPLKSDFIVEVKYGDRSESEED